ncbi:FecR family protein [Maribellus sediminis]|uniref:FecR family protein n=1 Tax=Maribellus sediminis TaxID=2696285 RepID=UPI001430360B|nr:FecR family protein [Maribellus sediminis]
MGKKIETLFLAYLEGRISPEDEQFLLDWLKRNPESIRNFNEFRRLWNMSMMAGKLDNRELELEWKELCRKIESAPLVKQRTIRSPYYWISRIAAVFLLGAVMSFFVSYLLLIRPNQQITYQEITTPAGAKSQITLPDGTNVWLNAKSHIKYSSEYGAKNRIVELEGEAFFDVETNPSKVFIVRTSEIDVKAYGTVFNVKSYPEENTIETTLLEGKIGVTRKELENRKSDEVVMEPNQRVVYYRKMPEIPEVTSENDETENPVEAIERPEQKLTYLISKGIDPHNFTSWKDGTLFISSETLERLAVKLERKYDVKIHFRDEALKNLKFTGSLENETVEQVMEAIRIAAQIDYEIEDRDIWLKQANN